jgi:hypothetical protein
MRAIHMERITASLILFALILPIIMFVALEVVTVEEIASGNVRFSLHGGSLIEIPLEIPNARNASLRIAAGVSGDSTSSLTLKICSGGSLILNETINPGETRSFSIQVEPSSKVRVVASSNTGTALGSLYYELGYSIPALYTVYLSLLAPVAAISGVLVGIVMERLLVG